MVEIIGIATMVALSWVVASGMANESDAEKRRCARTDSMSQNADEAAPLFSVKDAA